MARQPDPLRADAVPVEAAVASFLDKISRRLNQQSAPHGTASPPPRLKTSADTRRLAPMQSAMARWGIAMSHFDQIWTAHEKVIAEGAAELKLAHACKDQSQSQVVAGR